MQIQFDPFSFVVALIAVLIAWRAHFLAKKAPGKARRQEIRDQVRELLDGLTADLAKLRAALNRGTAVYKSPADFDARAETLAALAKRLPETPELLLIESVLGTVAANWSTTFFDESQLNRARDSHREWEDAVLEARSSGVGLEQAQANRDNYSDQVETARAKTDASKTRLRESLDLYTERHQIYFQRLNSLDRGVLEER